MGLLETSKKRTSWHSCSLKIPAVILYKPTGNPLFSFGSNDIWITMCFLICKSSFSPDPVPTQKCASVSTKWQGPWSWIMMNEWFRQVHRLRCHCLIIYSVCFLRRDCSVLDPFFHSVPIWPWSSLLSPYLKVPWGEMLMLPPESVDVKGQQRAQSRWNS
jgi:hypothetical protein